MKNGDLVVMPNAVDHTRRNECKSTGLIVNEMIVRGRIGVMWSDGEGQVDYEPVKWLEVVSEGR